MGLTVANGNIHIGFGSICDIEPFTGWMLAYSQKSLSQVGVFNANPNRVPISTAYAGSSGAGIWQAGIASVIDPGRGNIIFATGNSGKLRTVAPCVLPYEVSTAVAVEVTNARDMPLNRDRR
jgi:hypothetical protein